MKAIALETLRKRRSEKWATYPPDVLPAFVAEMDFALAPPIRHAIDEAVELGDVGYAASSGVAPAFARFARERFDWPVDGGAAFAVPDVMAGVAEALHLLTTPGDGVVINPPVYPPFFEVIPHEGRTIVEAPLRRDDGERWSLDLDAVERAFAAGAKAYLLCSPHNPVGRVWPENELRSVNALCERYRVALISDEIHAPLVMPGVGYAPVLRFGSARRTVAVWSASKAFNIPGLKCAVVACSDDVRDAMRSRLKSRAEEIETRIGHLGVIATIAAFDGGGAWLDDLLAYLDGNRHALGALLRERIPAARYVEPEATYLAWIDCGGLGIEGDPAQRFLEQGRVALEPGRKFGSSTKSYVRLNFGTSREILDEIVARMAAALR